MKRIAYALLCLLVIIACGKTNKGVVVIETRENLTKGTIDEAPATADYGTLLSNYTCNMTVAEVAEILEVPEDNLSIPNYAKSVKCYFDLRGFGENAVGGTTIIWGPIESSKANIKKEIATYLKNQKELPKSVTMGMGIELAETKDCYLAFQPAHGRVIILNENYDNMFVLTYGNRRIVKTRSKEQHDSLKAKMIKLANYLLKKHKK